MYEVASTVSLVVSRSHLEIHETFVIISLLTKKANKLNLESDLASLNFESNLAKYRIAFLLILSADIEGNIPLTTMEIASTDFGDGYGNPMLTGFMLQIGSV